MPENTVSDGRWLMNLKCLVRPHTPMTHALRARDDNTQIVYSNPAGDPILARACDTLSLPGAVERCNNPIPAAHCRRFPFGRLLRRVNLYTSPWAPSCPSLLA